MIEINQTCATAVTGCFSGDVSGFPVTIDGSAGRSYRLTSDLVVGLANVNAINLLSSRVQLDLNGFSLVGVGIGVGTGRGVAGSGAAIGARIRNGTIRGFRGAGISLLGASSVRVEDLTLELNQGGGVELGDRALVVDNIVANSGGNGIAVGDHGVVRGNVVSESGALGILAFDGCKISGNTADEGSGGIYC